MSPLPITAVNQIRPKVDDSATVAHWKRLSTDDSTTSDTTTDVVVVVTAPRPPITKTLLLLTAATTSMDDDESSCPIVELKNAIIFCFSLVKQMRMSLIVFD